MLNKLLIQKKMALLIDHLADMEPLIKGKSVEEIKADGVTHVALERYFQLSVDAMVDINIHILREGGFGPVDDLQSTFKALGEHNILELTFAEKIAPIVGVRNMVMCRYEKRLDIDLFLQNLRNNFSDFKTYLTQIHAYVEKHL